MLLYCTWLSTSSCVIVYFAYNVTLDVFPSPITCNSSISVTAFVHSASEYTGNVTFISFPSLSVPTNVSDTGTSYNVTFPVFVTVIV